MLTKRLFIFLNHKTGDLKKNPMMSRQQTLNRLLSESQEESPKVKVMREKQTKKNSQTDKLIGDFLTQTM